LQEPGNEELQAHNEHVGTISMILAFFGSTFCVRFGDPAQCVIVLVTGSALCHTFHAIVALLDVLDMLGPSCSVHFI
jgi:hypothetical protein